MATDVIPMVKQIAWDRDWISNSEDFRRMITHYIPLLGRTDMGARIIAVDDATAYRNQGKFYKLLASQNSVIIRNDMYWITMRVNGYDCPEDYDGVKTTFIMPDQRLYDSIVHTYAANQAKRQKEK